MLAKAYMAKITTAMKRMISHHDIWITRSHLDYDSYVPRRIG
jgi:hypothetical protein